MRSCLSGSTMARSRYMYAECAVQFCCFGYNYSFRSTCPAQELICQSCHPHAQFHSKRFYIRVPLVRLIGWHLSKFVCSSRCTAVHIQLATANQSTTVRVICIRLLTQNLIHIKTTISIDQGSQNLCMPQASQNMTHYPYLIPLPHEDCHVLSSTIRKQMPSCRPEMLRAARDAQTLSTQIPDATHHQHFAYHSVHIASDNVILADDYGRCIDADLPTSTCKLCEPKRKRRYVQMAEGRRSANKYRGRLSHGPESNHAKYVAIFVRSLACRECLHNHLYLISHPKH